MRIAILSDIHANLEALRAILDALSDKAIDKYVCLGDVVGYGAQPNEVCSIVRELCSHVVVGNHDAAVCGRMDYSYYRPEARLALDWHARMLEPQHVEWLTSLPYEARIGDLALCHGSPLVKEEFGYIFVLEQMRDLVDSYDTFAMVTFIGHSHLCKSFSFSREGAEEVLTTRFETEPDRKYVVTAGSVGQPRDNDSRACCGLYDTETCRFEYVRASYDIEAAASKIARTELSPAFGKRLFLGI